MEDASSDKEGLALRCAGRQESKFAFVVFTVAKDAQVLPDPSNEMLTVVAAISMALTPLAVAVSNLSSGRLHQPIPRNTGAIDSDGACVITAELERVEQIASRMVLVSGIKNIVLDNDPELINSVRRFGFKVF